MEIYINGKTADITLDTEKTLGDVLSGIEQWLSHSGNRIQGIKTDGKDISTDALGEVFDRDIAEIRRLDIEVSPWRELAAEALASLLETCGLYKNASFDERGQIVSAWEKSAAARFLSTDIPDIHRLAGLTLSGEGLTAGDLAVLVEERLRELGDTAGEINGAQALVNAIAARMEELPLDLQTGKDQKAAETMQLFSQIGEKLFRIFFIFKSEGLSLDDYAINNAPARAFIDDFNAALRELSSAYETQDTVLAGDIAEYELAPRLLTFYASLRELAN